jgi:hypothetical protein
MSTVVSVKWLRTILVLATLGLWFPATNHCRLELIPGLEFLRCASDTAEANCDADCATDGCDVVEKGLYKSENDRPAVPLPRASFALLVPSLAEMLCRVAVSQPQSVFAPPELPKVWQFSYRTALPPRAPSIAS